MDFAQTILQGKVGSQAGADGSRFELRQDQNGAAVITGAHGYYTEASRRGRLFMSRAVVTAPVIFSTAAGTGGPLLWNGTNAGPGGANASILAVGFGVTTVTTVAAALGLTGGTGQTVAPTSTTAIDSTTNMLLGGAPSACTTYRVGTPAAAGSFFFPFADLHTGALTVDNKGVNWFLLDGMFTVPPNGWISVAASATASTTVAQISLVWEELPI